MKDASEQLKQIINNLVEQRARIDVRIKALRAALRALGDNHITPTPPRKPTRSVDRRAPTNTLVFLQTRRRPVSVATVARALRTTTSAATQRLAKLVDAGKATRIKRGVFVAKHVEN